MVGKIFVKEVGFEPGVEKRRSYEQARTRQRDWNEVDGEN